VEKSLQELKFAARIPLVNGYKISVMWICDLSISQLQLLEKAIKLAEAAQIDWRTEWIENDVAAKTVIEKFIPNLMRESTKIVGITKTREIAGDEYVSAYRSKAPETDAPRV
jgi:hypothetical protein